MLLLLILLLLLMMMIKCSLYDFYDIIYINSMFTCPYIYSGYSAIHSFISIQP